MVISQFHPIIGGAEKQAQLLAKTLMQKGVNVRIVTGWWNFKTPRKEVIDRIEVVRNFSCWRMFGIRGIRTLGGLIYMFTLGIYLFIHRREYDIIHVHQALYPAFISVFAGKRILHKPVLVKTASSGKTSDIEELKRFPLGKLQLRWLLKEMDYLVAISKVSGKDFEEIGYPKERIVNIPNGVEISEEIKTSYDQALRVITVTRLSNEKGVDVLIQSWAKIVAEEKSLKLVIIGTGPEKEEIQKKVSSLKIGESIEFAGFVNDVKGYLRCADLFILPSRTEGMSNALLEAMSYGIPCIVTKVGGNGELMVEEDKEIQSGGYVIARNGLLVNPDDAEGLCKAILYLLRHRGEREELGKRSRQFILENFSIDCVAERYINLYKSILNESR